MIRAFPPANVDPRFLLEPFEPAYLALHRAGALGALGAGHPLSGTWETWMAPNVRIRAR
jgi:hypothetical protein